MNMQPQAEPPGRLPGWLLSQLFPDALVQMSPSRASSLKTDTLGGYGKRILILVRQSDTAVIREADLSFLLNILHACRLGMPDVRLLNLAHADFGQEALLRDHEPATVLLFGASAADIGLPMHFPDFQVQEFRGVKFLSAPDLPALEVDMPAKKRLWAGLKQL
ncbi:MAG: hypothetical protein EBZ67_13940, partial [Chitinophagia bacterium]|nr:hypothetical protein [Chitinophagia bacterium]